MSAADTLGLDPDMSLDSLNWVVFGFFGMAPKQIHETIADQGHEYGRDDGANAERYAVLQILRAMGIEIHGFQMEEMTDFFA